MSAFDLGLLLSRLALAAAAAAAPAAALAAMGEVSLGFKGVPSSSCGAADFVSPSGRDDDASPPRESEEDMSGFVPPASVPAPLVPLPVVNLAASRPSFGPTPTATAEGLPPAAAAALAEPVLLLLMFTNCSSFAFECGREV